MRISLLAVGLLVCLACAALSQSLPPWTIQEADGTPRKTSPTRIIVSNGSLSCSGGTCTLATGTGSVGGSNKQVQVNTSGVLSGAAGFEYQSGASPNVSITARNDAHRALE